MLRTKLLFAALFVFLSGTIAAFAPLEATLGANARLVYFHGAWVWTALLCFALSALLGIAAFFLPSPKIVAWCRSLGLSGIFFWLTFLPMSLLVMQANWNGLFLQEPRFRLPLNFAVVGLLIQAGIHLIDKPGFTSALNAFFGLTLFIGMSRVQTVLHPESPLLNPGAGNIRVYFLAILMLQILGAWELSRGVIQLLHKPKRNLE